jgi:transcriptional regulator with XRE-family HTH domain
MSEDLPLTPNQVVASNLKRARELRGWTQEQAAERLERYLGSRWSKANYSAAERAVTGRRPRTFDADDLLAFARTFELPITWFLLPPHGREPLLSTPDDPDGVPPTLMLDWLYRVDEEERRRVTDLCRATGVGEGEETNHQHAVREKARDYLAALAQAAIDEHGASTPAALRSLADVLEHGAAAAPAEVAARVAGERADRSADEDPQTTDGS